MTSHMTRNTQVVVSMPRSCHTQVTAAIVKPATEGRHCRYVDLLAEEGKGGAVSSGRPFYFISHGWDRPFSELVNMCKHHFEAERQRAWRRGLPLLQLSEVGGERGRWGGKEGGMKSRKGRS